MAIKIICIQRENSFENPYDGITHVGWIEDSTGKRGQSTINEMVRFIEQYGNTVAYVEEGGKRSYVSVISSVFTARKSIRTYAGNEFTDALLRLPDCAS
ncbi:MAG: hypothetical protein JO026_01645 [Patescibacteria group bacterium]|nr:hypothetical protein [Patescibacteria group bacterium]